jgi:hypothetical protein
MCKIRHVAREVQQHTPLRYRHVVCASPTTAAPAPPEEFIENAHGVQPDSHGAACKSVWEEWGWPRLSRVPERRYRLHLFEQEATIRKDSRWTAASSGWWQWDGIGQVAGIESERLRLASPPRQWCLLCECYGHSDNLVGFLK